MCSTMHRGRQTLVASFTQFAGPIVRKTSAQRVLAQFFPAGIFSLSKDVSCTLELIGANRRLRCGCQHRASADADPDAQFVIRRAV
jgi:hypothetical protein